jgi:hypothetical protein
MCGNQHNVIVGRSRYHDAALQASLVSGYMVKRSMAGNDNHRIDMNTRYVRWRVVSREILGPLAQASSRSISFVSRPRVNLDWYFKYRVVSLAQPSSAHGQRTGCWPQWSTNSRRSDMGR